MEPITFLEAIRQGLIDELERDPNVFLLGEDIGVYGGAFKVTAGLLSRFGAERVIDTPISESGIVGAAIGASFTGMKPIVEMQFMDFISNAHSMIVNFAAKCHYRWGQAVPLVIRGPWGGMVHAGPFHSQCPEVSYAHIPGLKVVVPSTVYDAKGLLKAAIRDPNPVIFLEHKALYRRLKEVLPSDDYVVPLGKAAIRRAGTDLSILSYGAMVHRALEAATALEQEGLSVEVLDLRTLQPLDEEAILATARKTGKVILLHEDTKTLGLGAELSALIAEKAFEFLDGPLVRLGALDTPVPLAAALEDAFLPSVERIRSAALELARY
ncbi:MAG: alpha-ketoacid dehydrogenase subunit beta [Myxococcota bacterium]